MPWSVLTSRPGRYQGPRGELLVSSHVDETDVLWVGALLLRKQSDESRKARFALGCHLLGP